MPTTVHLSAQLLAAAERRARALGISRNRLIVRALEREIQDRSTWSPGFLDALRDVEPETAAAADELAAAIRRDRRSKPPARL